MFSYPKDTFDLTIIIPVTNMYRRLDNFKKMSRDANYFNINLIVVHDKRDSNTGPELRTITRKYKNIKMIEGEYGSAGTARNMGLTFVNTSWVGFWDSDDLPIVTEYINLLAKIKLEGNLVGYGQFRKMSNDNAQSKSNTSGLNQQKNYELVLNPGIWRWIFHSKHIENLKFPNFKIGEDVCFLFSVLQITKSITVAEKVIYGYTVNNPLQSSQIWKHRSKNYLIIKYLSENFVIGQENKNIILGLLVHQFYISMRRDKFRFKNIAIKYFLICFLKMSPKEKILCSMWLLLIPFKFLISKAS